MQAKDDASLAELLPCPFCGGEAVTFRSVLPTPINESWGVSCNNTGLCQASIDCQATEAEAIAAWNRRQQSGDAVEQSPLEASPVDVERVKRAAVDAVHLAKFPKERWSCGRDESGIALTLSRQQRFIAKEVEAALQPPPVEQPASAAEQGWGFRAIKPTSPEHAAVLEDLARRIDDE